MSSDQQDKDKLEQGQQDSASMMSATNPNDGK